MVQVSNLIIFLNMFLQMAFQELFTLSKRNEFKIVCLKTP